MDALTASIGAAGESLAAATTSKATTGTRTRYGTVAANNGTTLDVTLSGGTLAALPMTADCTGAAAGDRVAVSVDGPLATVTGIVATSDTGGYDIFAGTKVINTSSSNALFTDAEFTAAFGRSFNSATDCIVGMNGDSAAQSGKTCDLSYNPDTKGIYLEGIGASGHYRVNYILAMPSGSTRTVAQGVASATSRATTAAEAANAAAKAAQEAASGVSEATDKANAAAESATTAAGKVDGAITEATEAATKATDAAAGAEGAATSATSAAGEATTAATTATTAADGAAKVNATLDGTKLTVTDRTGASTTVDTKGETGATGAKGDKGDKGDTGAKGADGEVTYAYLKSYAETLQEAEYDRQVARGTYAGRSIMSILGCSTWADTYAALHAKVSAADFSGLRVGDYLDVTFTGTDLITTATQRFVLAHFDPWYKATNQSYGHHLAFVANNCMAVASASSYASGSYIMWQTTANNNGTSTDAHPYAASNLHAFEVKLAAELPSSISEYVLDRYEALEVRYNASGAINASTSTSWASLGKLWSPSEVDVYGATIYGTAGHSVGTSRQLDYFRRIRGNTSTAWWTRTPYSGSSVPVSAVTSSSQAGYYNANATYCRPRPCFLFA